MTTSERWRGGGGQVEGYSGGAGGARSTMRDCMLWRRGEGGGGGTGGTTSTATTTTSVGAMCCNSCVMRSHVCVGRGCGASCGHMCVWAMGFMRSLVCVGHVGAGRHAFTCVCGPCAVTHAACGHMCVWAMWVRDVMRSLVCVGHVGAGRHAVTCVCGPCGCGASCVCGPYGCGALCGHLCVWAMWVRGVMHDVPLREVAAVVWSGVVSGFRCRRLSPPLPLLPLLMRSLHPLPWLVPALPAHTHTHTHVSPQAPAPPAPSLTMPPLPLTMPSPSLTMPPPPLPMPQVVSHPYGSPPPPLGPPPPALALPQVVTVPDVSMIALDFSWSSFASPDLWAALLSFLYLDFLDTTGALFSMATYLGHSQPGVCVGG